MTVNYLDGKIFAAVKRFEHYLQLELPQIDHIFGTPQSVCLYHSTPHLQNPVFWYSNIWLEPFTFSFDSISQGAAVLKSYGRNWACSPFCSFRRAALIHEKLPPISAKAKAFPWDLPSLQMGAWTLLDDHTILASAKCSSPFPRGEIEFVADHIEAPSRAYLKLYEALTLFGRPPPGASCFDAGASPGGWTWVLANLGCNVTACDRALIDERLLLRPNVNFLKHDAFTLKPQDIGKIDWLFSDVICYPNRLFSWIEKWLESGLCSNFVCTIKMQGECDFKTVRSFAAIEGSSLLHLHHNKHELTWIKRCRSKV
ncbi:MAG: SAM-dependent methyltransferase [Termitinemataceae bacterium]|nr:MAG: SAM-dependent methyltransferase [Termitinemataceae bacterium]